MENLKISLKGSHVCLTGCRSHSWSWISAQTNNIMWAFPQNSTTRCSWKSSLPDGDAGVMGHPAGHHGLGPLDDTLVLRRFRDAGTCCKHTQERLLHRGCVWTADLERAYWTRSHLSVNVSPEQRESYAISAARSICEDCYCESMRWEISARMSH